MMSPYEQPNSASGGGQLPPPPPPPPIPDQFTTSTSNSGTRLPRKKPSKKLIVISSVVAVVLIAGISAFFIAQNILRGGAATPQEAGKILVDSINEKDVVSLFGMVSPRERDAVMNLQKQAEESFKNNGIPEAIKSTSPATTENLSENTELSFDGVELTISGATPVVTELSEDYALLRYSSGEFSMTIRPEETKGLIRTGFESGGTMDVVKERKFIADLGPQNSGLTLVASKTDGRWYVSPLLSSLDSINAWSNYEYDYGSEFSRGDLPVEFQPGADSPETAATNGVRAFVDAVNQNDIQLLAPAVAKDEAAALYLYPGLWHTSGASNNSNELTLGDATFTGTQMKGNRGRAVAKNVVIGIGSDNDKDLVAISENCIEDNQGEKLCLNGSGFFSPDGATASNAMSLASIDGKFALTTVKEDGTWKVSLLDSVSDMATSWLKSLTPEQALSFLGLERATAVNGDIPVGAKVSVPLNSAGYAVQTLKVDKQQKIALDADSSISGEVYAPGADGRLTSESHKCSLYGTNSGCELPAGQYVLLVDATDSESWATGFKNEGSKFQTATELTVQRFVEPPRVDGNTEGQTIYLGYSSSRAEVTIPEKTNKKLILEFDEQTTVPDALRLSIGDKSIIVDGRKSRRTVINLPRETGEFEIYFESLGDSWNWYDANPKLYFADE